MVAVEEVVVTEAEAVNEAVMVVITVEEDAVIGQGDNYLFHLRKMLRFYSSLNFQLITLN